MSNSSFTGGERAPMQADGRDVDALGPSDSSDSGSDIQGATEIDAADELGNIGQADHLGRAGSSDASGTGERGSALLGDDIRDGNDILPDHIAGDEDALFDDGASGNMDDVADEMSDDSEDSALEDSDSENSDSGDESDDEDDVASGSKA